MSNNNQVLILVFIVLAQFLCTSLWFAGNAVAGELANAFELPGHAAGRITSLVQFGFISGTLLFAILGLSDRFSPSKVFFFSSILGALANLSIIWTENISILYTLRFFTGFFLAGIYPVGMKIASDFHKKGLGVALGFLVGALVLGTASPHLLKNLFSTSSWQYVFYLTSSFAILGGLIILLGVGDGPHRKRGQTFDFSTFFRVFNNKSFRASSFGYFGHMWELYAFWAYVPVFIQSFLMQNHLADNTSIWSFSIIGIGSLGCIIGGFLSIKFGNKTVAGVSLFGSLLMCLLSPLFFLLPAPLFFSLLLIWGVLVITDSPQFSTLVAKTAPSESTGTALTIVNCLGFAITIVSIELLGQIKETRLMFLILAIGPALGLIYFLKGLKGSYK